MTDTQTPAETPPWQEPPVRSQRCLDLLDRLQRGRYRPAESTIWMEDRKAAKRAGVHEWEWRNLIVRAWCERVAAKPDCPWPVLHVPHCPNQILQPSSERDYRTGDGYTKVIQAYCVCPEPDAESWHEFWHRTHWVSFEGTQLYCQCGPKEEPPGSGYRGINGDGYVCETCAPLLITKRWTYGHREEITEAGHVGDGVAWSHRLKCDCRCCYCGGAAKERRGWRLNGHAPMTT